jgi:hypothetical protein
MMADDVVTMSEGPFNVRKYFSEFLQEIKDVLKKKFAFLQWNFLTGSALISNLKHFPL